VAIRQNLSFISDALKIISQDVAEHVTRITANLHLRFIKLSFEHNQIDQHIAGQLLYPVHLYLYTYKLVCIIMVDFVEILVP
jgi:hypothetical protein